MKKVLLTSLLLLCFPVLAEWKFIGVEEDSRNQFFLDFETLRKEGNLRWVWQVVNIKSENQYGWVSIRAKMEYDCKNETSKTISATAFSQEFARGKDLHQSNEMEAKTYIAPNTVASTLLKEVCKR